MCDIAQQTGRMWSIDHIVLQAGADQTIGSVAAAPLSHPLGVLGVLLLIDLRPAAFRHGCCLLLAQSLPMIVQSLEQVLEDHHAYTDAAEGEIVIDACGQCDVISLVSHELRGPLTAIKGYAELLRAYGIACCDQKSDPPGAITADRQQHYLDRILEQAHHLEVLTGDLLDISRIQAGRLALRCRWTDIARLCQCVAQVMQDSVEQQQPGRYHIRYYGNVERLLIWADPDRVQQVLTNLLENAVKYSPGGGVIELLLRQNLPADVISITVRDNGIGIPHQQQWALFQPFSRIQQPAAKAVAGNGLGLYITRKLVEAMNGCVELQSREGEGTSITFTLPIAHHFP